MFGLFRTKPHSITPKKAEDIINAYGAVMMRKPTMVCDERDLPFSKAEIKEAIRVCLRLVGSDTDSADQLRAGYIALADYQPLTSQERAVVARYDASVRSMPDLSSPEAMSAYLAGFEEYQKLTQRVLEDSAVLLAEIGHGEAQTT